jgi:hypothetical protein
MDVNCFPVIMNGCYTVPKPSIIHSNNRHYMIDFTRQLQFTTHHFHAMYAFQSQQCAKATHLHNNPDNDIYYQN